MKKILVAGAGHGGLSAAAILSKNGYDVTVVEKQTKETIGHDWHDAMDIPAFHFADIPVPPEDCFKRGLHMCYYNPKKTVKLNTDEGPGAASSNGITIDRKFLIQYLIEHCEKCGVKFIFGADIKEALTENTKVLGIKAVIDGKEKEFTADMTVDAAGMFSPVRKSLPEQFGIQRDFAEDDIIEIYRAYYENPDKYITDPNYSVFFYNCGKPGLDWVITEEEYIDVLIGKFGSLTEEEIDTSLEDLRKLYPGMGTTPIRGGHTAKIPLSKTLPMIIADSYALVGDSAGMTVPLNGSGINLSLQAGKLLAAAVMAAEKRGYKKEDLWQYQYRYFTLFGNNLVPISIMRRFFGAITAEDIDFFLEKNILTEKEIGMAGGNFSEVNAAYIINKLSAAAPKIKLLPSLLKTISGMPMLPSIYKMMPDKWDDKKIQNWIEKYSEL
ncbi:MAG: NAD(P)/FAD-dependent oxidoreductase [Ruminococcaceae bacterium]|nr:NAD(P)/FAD-dependent oxidoreductase [Oscillospiraceae bacterium]